MSNGTQRKSSRLNPRTTPESRLELATFPEFVNADSAESDTDAERTFIEAHIDIDDPQTTEAMDELKKQLEEMRLQLDAAEANAETEKQERIRLQDIVLQKQNNVVDKGAAVICPTVSSAPVNQTSSLAITSGVCTSATTTTMCTGYEFVPRSSYAGASQQASSGVSRIPRIASFMPSLTTLQPFRHASFTPTPMSSATPSSAPGPSNQHTAQYNGYNRKLHELPEFTGRPEDWPMFCTAYQESTARFNYSNTDNLFRLQKCLKGPAREVVESLIIHPSSVDQAMAALEFRFGRQEILMQSQLRKVREITSIPESKLEMLVPFATKVQNLSTFLEASGMYQHLANPTLIEELVSKLPMSKRLEWAQRSIYIEPYATIRHFEEWLTSVARLVCLVTPVSAVPQAKVEQRSNTRNVLHAREHRSENPAVSPTCRLCKEKPHPVQECCSYLNLNVPDRWKLVKRQRLCFSCLKYGHSLRSCRARKTCGTSSCERMHHSSLHEERESPSTSKASNETSNGTAKNMLSCNVDKNNKILFRVLPVRVYGDGVVVKTYALLDEGSSVTIMSTELARRLRLRGHSTDLKLQWFGKETFTDKSFAVDLRISADKDDAKEYNMENVQTVNGLNLPTQSLIINDLKPAYAPNVLSSLPIIEYKDIRPQILIGLDNCHLGAPIQIIGSINAGPVIAETKLGYVVYGKTVSITDDSTEGLILHCDQADDKDCDIHLNRIVDEYFSIDSFGVKKPKEKLISPADRRALQIMSSTTKRIRDRFQTGLLWKDDVIELPSSFEMARRRLWNLENKLQKDPQFAADYGAIISSYVKKGYARKLTDVEAAASNPRTWYLPHFGVRNPNKPGKVRLVFDAAATVNGISLNSKLLKGPDDHTPLLAILFKFRMRPIAVTGDIKEMFHQVVIQPEDQDAQRFLWRTGKEKPIDVYVMRSMTFGASCSPCSANFVMNLNAKRFVNAHPRAIMSIADRHYVDDFVDGFDSVAEAVEVTKAVIAIHQYGGFELRNISSNSKKVARSFCGLTDEESESRIVDMNVEAVTEKVLGMCWQPFEDVFVFKLKFPRVSRDVMEFERCPTKREFLAIAMSVFDPYGMIANFVVHVKLLLQSVWKYGIGWDDPIPNDIYEKWRQWKNELQALKLLKVPRCHHPSLSAASRIVLHTFVDASEEAFSAVTYLRIEHDEEIKVSFVCGKVKCAPKKLISIPRLELSAAVLGVRLSDSVGEYHGIPVADRMFWCDSKTVLSWLRSDPRHQKQFVGFRIAEILDSSTINQWRWISTKINPADEATRARYPPRFQNDSNWIKGPSYMQLPETDWPVQPDDIGDYVTREEMKPKFLLHFGRVSSPIFNFSSLSKYSKLRRTAAWVIRFIKLCLRRPTEKGELSATELDEAERVLCREAQADCFYREITQLSCQQQVDRTSSIHKLTPYLDGDGLLRVHGRIDAATTVPFSARRPIILPKDHHLTKLIVTFYHCRQRHQNDDTITNEIRQKFWVPNLRSAVKKARNNCPFCKIRFAMPLPPLMGQLPEDRLTPFVRPFTYTGLDYFGPVYVTIGRNKVKRWIALFTCMTVRAVHLEIAADLSTDACILCIRNFVNRRGVPARIRSDNGTNFIGSRNELVTSGVFDGEAIKAELSARGIEWIFNCPSNPHAGGCWERLVRSVKRALSHTLCELAPKPETLTSALIEAENIVNSRPLTHLPVSSEEEEPLTPNHFLTGTVNSTQTPGHVDDRSLCLRKQWRISKQIKDRFWRRWIKEYLPELTKRSKWFTKVSPLKEGDLVLICDVDVPRHKWIRGRIAKVFPGPDGQTRVADIQTTTGILRRPAVKLAVLEVGEAEVGVAPHGGWDVK